MICYNCLSELISSFYFFNKVQEADHKLRKILDNLANIDLEKENATNFKELEEIDEKSNIHIPENMSLEAFEEENSEVIDEHTDLEILEEKDFDSQAEDCTEDTQSCDDPIETIDLLLSEGEFIDECYEIDQNSRFLVFEKEALKEKYSELPCNILSNNDVTSIISNFNNSQQNTAQEVVPTSLKKTRARLPRKYSKIKDKSGRNNHIENGSFVVAQFVPSSTTIQIESTTPDCPEEIITVNELRTMDYAAVEIKGSKQIEINEADCSTSEKDDERVYLCQYCPRAFSSSQFLITHVRKSHACKYCTRAFEKNSDLFKHIRLKHSSHKCVICDRDFTTNSNLRHHLKRVHGVQLPVHISLLSFKKDGNENNLEEDFELEEHLEDTDNFFSL